LVLVFQQVLDAELALEDEDSLLDYADIDSDAEGSEVEGDLVLEDDVGGEEQRGGGRRRKLSEVVTFGWDRSDVLPVGLENLGNTCYMAAAVQMLRAVPELMRSVLTAAAGGEGGEGGMTASADLEAQLLQAMRLLYELT
jgi:hypothetical protein